MLQSEVTRQVVEGFLADRLGHWLAHDVTFHDLTGFEESRGRASAVFALDALFRGWTRAGVQVVETQLIVDCDHAAASWVVEADGGEVTVRIPMAADFEVRDGEIVRLRLLYDSAHRSGPHRGDRPGAGV